MLLAGVATAASAAGQDRPGLYAIDPVHTRVQFSVDHAGFSRALGTVSGSEGTITFAPGQWQLARIEVVVPLERLDLGDQDWNDAARRILDAGDHPRAHFVSNRVEPLGPQAARVCGDLTLHGATRDFCLDVQFNQLKRHPLPPFHRIAGFSASGHLQRSDFGIDAWSSLVGDTVELRIEAEARFTGVAGTGAET